MDPQRVVLPVDRASRRADRAVPTAVAAARLFGCPLELIQFVEDPHEVRQADDALDEMRTAIRRDSPDVVLRSSTVVEPHAPQGISAAIQPAHLPVIATRATHFGIAHYLGSAADHVVATSGRPVLMVGPSADADHAFTFDRVLVALDPQSPALETIPLARHWAARVGVPLVAVAVIVDDADPGETHARLLAQMQLALPSNDVADLRVLRSADASTAICDLAKHALVVMASHARTGLRRVAFGSVTTEVVRSAQRAVLVVLAAPDLGRGRAPERASSAAAA